MFNFRFHFTAAVISVRRVNVKRFDCFSVFFCLASPFVVLCNAASTNFMGEMQLEINLLSIQCGIN